ncbi:MAG: alpha/beta fold hydrolase [Gammaproteobacteria bacterium]|jgi:pimeloyl-ACP methyl ester carboxylesterase|nr:alpha/beta fold hydrolase [Gammaproteobacteria bacterium]
MRTSSEFAQQLSNGLTLRGRRWNAGAPVPVLALHGWLDNANSFVPMAAHLPDAIDLIALDHCGHGLSDHRPPGNWYQLVDFAYEAGAVARLQGWQHYHLLGHSLGGASACLLAAACPQRITSLSLIEGLGPLAGKANQSAVRLRQAWLGLDADLSSKLRTHDSPESAAQARLSQTRMQPESVRLLTERGLQQTGDGWQWRSDPRLRIASAVRMTETEILHILQAIACPVVQIMPDPPSALMPLSVMQRRSASVQHYTEHSLPGYHHLHMDSPEPCADRIFNFILKHA